MDCPIQDILESERGIPCNHVTRTTTGNGTILDKHDTWLLWVELSFKIHMLEFQLLVPPNVTFFRNNVIAITNNWDEVTLDWASFIAQSVKNLPAMQETQVHLLGWKDPLEKKMATHSSILTWRIPWTEERSRLQSTGL